MEGEERRKKILAILQEIHEPVSGSEMSAKLGVSRQVIVQDIALLRAVNKNILSTNKGYILHQLEKETAGYRRSIGVNHGDQRILEELNIIVDSGAKVLDVVVEHEIYGQITVDLCINSRRDAKEFVEKVRNSHSLPLKELTNGVHYHTIEAASEEILSEVEQLLRKAGF